MLSLLTATHGVRKPFFAWAEGKAARLEFIPLLSLIPVRYHDQWSPRCEGIW